MPKYASRWNCLALLVSSGVPFWALGFVGGCSSSNPLGTLPVSGKVTYNGQPVAGATVTFVGDGNTRTATAITGADGSYQLATLNYPGAMPGRYTVVVEKIETPPELNRTVSMEEAAQNAAKPLPKAKRALPAKYGDAAKTPLSAEIKTGQANTVDLSLSN